MTIGIGLGVQIATALALAARGVVGKQTHQLVEEIAVGPEMRERAAFTGRALHLDRHRGAVVTVKTIALNPGRAQVFALKNVPEGGGHAGRAGAGGTGYGHDWMLFAHRLRAFHASASRGPAGCKAAGPWA